MNKETKIIMGGILAVLIICAPVLGATPMPYPINVYVNGYVDGGFNVQITDLSTGVSRTGTTDWFTDHAEMVEDGANFNSASKLFQSTDTFRFIILECSSNPGCVKDMAFGDGIIVKFDLLEMFKLPEVIVPAEPPIESPDEPMEPEVVTETNWELLLAVIGLTGFGVYIYKGKIKLNKKGMESILLAMKPGQGIKISKGYTGSGKFLHRHKGVVGYHNSTTNHIKPEAKHEDYELPGVGN